MSNIIGMVFHYLLTTFDTPSTLFIPILGAIGFKIYFMYWLLYYWSQKRSINHPWYLIFLMILSGLHVDLAWMIRVIHLLFFPDLNESIMPFFITLFFIRWSWVSYLLFLLSIALFIDTFFDKKIVVRWYNTFFVGMFFVLFLYTVYVATFGFYLIDPYIRSHSLEFFMLSTLSILGPWVFIPAVAVAIKRLKDNTVSKLLKKQLKTFIIGFIAPYFALELAVSIPRELFYTEPMGTYLLQSLNGIIFSVTLYFTIRKMFNFRFLNTHDMVKASKKIDFKPDGYPLIVRRLQKAKKIEELSYIVRFFFRSMYGIPEDAVTVQVRHRDDALLYMHYLMDISQQMPSISSAREEIVEKFLLTYDDTGVSVFERLRDLQILLYDDICFSEHYEANKLGNLFLNFLTNLNASVFLPLFAEESLVGYVTVDRSDEVNHIFSDSEQLWMGSFAWDVSQVIKNQQAEWQRHNVIEPMLKDYKKVSEGLYEKHQEANQHREGIARVIEDLQGRDVGVLYYNGRTFSLVNDYVLKLIGGDPNEKTDNEVVSALLRIAEGAGRYRASLSSSIRTVDKKNLTINAFSLHEHNGVIITIVSLNIIDLVHKINTSLKGPSAWDYALYLQTTQSGKLVDQLIPGMGPDLLECKINLLRYSLSKKPLLLSVLEDDLADMVEVIRTISLRKTVHTLELKQPEESCEVAMQLFGINPILGTSKHKTALLDKLSSHSILLVKNIHLLHLETQGQLAKFLESGIYRAVKGNERHVSSVRIICSSNHDLESLVEQRKFHPALYAQLKDTHIALPSLFHLPKKEFSSLVAGIQDLIEPTMRKKVDLSEGEIALSLQKPIMSIRELKNRIYELLLQNASDVSSNEWVVQAPTPLLHDQELMVAKRLGIKALRDEKLLAVMWQKFDRSQARIADFLNTDRSTIHRWCKKYGFK